jgi:hypothetical protein
MNEKEIKLRSVDGKEEQETELLLPCVSWILHIRVSFGRITDLPFIAISYY